MSVASPPATSVPPAEPAKVRPPATPRLWPALFLVALYWIAYFGVTIFFPYTLRLIQGVVALRGGSPDDVPGPFIQFMSIFYAPMLLSLGILLWWIAFSRLPWLERGWGLACIILVGIGATFLAHKSMMMGMIMYAAPVAITAVILTLAFTRLQPARTRWLAVAIASVLAWGYFTLIRVNGVSGNLVADKSWRWDKTAEDRFLEERGRNNPEGLKSIPSQQPIVASAADWPEFRGPKRDGHVHNVSLNTDWSTQPPREVWRRRVGPGWSSFAVVGNRAFTQEQRGESEAVVCIDVATGQELWSHEDKVRFEETVAGAGPRATPTFHNGKIYSQGGSGVVNCLDAATGKSLWSRNVTADAKDTTTGKNLTPPLWGYSSSPLVASGVAVVFAGGKENNSVLGYDAESGELRWSAGKGWHSYSSPHPLKVAGEEHVLMVTERGLDAFDAATGKVLWEHDWNLQDMFRVVQPHAIGDSQVLVGTPMTEGTRLLTLAKEGDAWTTKEEWTSKDLKPYYNDFVQLGDHLYGFDNDILVCIDLATGKKKWKKGRYGHGQALLIGESGQLLVISDQGELVLTEVSPQGLKELAKFKVLTGKTWNHPVLTGNKLLVRNGEEMACFELTLDATAPDSAASGGGHSAGHLLLSGS